MALIEPGKPWHNGVTDSFDDKFREERLSLGWFRSGAEAKVIIETWRRLYKEVRPHLSLENIWPRHLLLDRSLDLAALWSDGFPGQPCAMPER